MTETSRPLRSQVFVEYMYVIALNLPTLRGAKMNSVPNDSMIRTFVLKKGCTDREYPLGLYIRKERRMVSVATLANVDITITPVANCEFPLNLTVKITASTAVGIHA